MHLVLFMTRGMSLAAWEDNGSLERELALYAEFAMHGCSTTVISWGTQRDKTIAARYPWLSVCVNRLNLRQNRYERLMPLLHARAFALADIIKSNQIDGADCAMRCARLWRKPFVARCGYLWSQNSLDAGHKDLPQAKNLEHEVFSHCDLGIVTTEDMRNYLEREYNIAHDTIAVVPNYVIRDWFAQSPVTQRESANAIVTQVGRLTEEKNCLSLIDACVGLPVTLRFIGDGPLKEKLQEHAVTRGVRAEFPGVRPAADLPCLLGESAVVTLVSLYEGHPKALIEAMARGCAVLGTRVRGIESCIKDGVTGLLCGTDAASIRGGLQRLLADAALRERLGWQARQWARRFQVESLALEELKLYGRFPALPTMGKIRSAACLSAQAMPRIARALRRRLGAMVSGRLTWGIMRLVNWRIRHATPASALRFLFELDAQLYPLEGCLAVAYDGGVHTKHRHTRYHDFFVQRLREGERVLDIGCGNGFLAYDMAAKAGATVTGIDLIGQNIAVAQKCFSHPNVSFVCGDALKDLPGRGVDTVVLSNVLEHLPNRVAFLRNVRVRIRPRRFLLRVPLVERDWRVPLKKELGIEWRLDATHETEYTREQFLCELARAGLFVNHEEIRWGEIWCEASDSVDYAEAPPEHPQITVLMSVHDGEKYLETAVNSILRQTFRNFVFLIVDDASTDATPAILADYAKRDMRISVITNPKNLGLTASLNNGLALVGTPYVARMDADDISLPNRLECQLEHMERHPELVACGCLWGLFDEDDPDARLIKQVLPTSPTQVRHIIQNEGPCIGHSAAFLRTTAMHTVKGYREQFTAAQDYDLWLRLLDIGELDNIPTLLHLYRRHAHTISSVRATEQAICHTLAMMSAECRRASIPDIMDCHPAALETLERHLDPAQPSFATWIRLLTTRPLDGRGQCLHRALLRRDEKVAG